MAPSVEQRVQIIVRMMASGEWETGKSASELAAAWGLAQNTVEQSASEASRAIHRGIALNEEVRSLLIAQLQNCVAAAQGMYAKCQGEPGTASYKVALEALRVKIEGIRVLLGVVPAWRQKDESDDLGRLSIQELQAIIAKETEQGTEIAQ